MQNVLLQENQIQDTLSNAYKDPVEVNIYVGTYHKYNNASIAGEWLNLCDFDDYGQLLEKVKVIHADEEDPELMVQDSEYLPDSLYRESWYSDTVKKWLDYASFVKEDPDRQEALDIYINNCLGSPINQEMSQIIDSFEQSYCGHHNASFYPLRDYLEELRYEEYERAIADYPFIANGFSWKEYAESLEDCYWEKDGHIFDNNV